MPHKPVPSPDPATRPYWEAAARRELRIPRCADCGKYHFYPRPACPYCSSTQFEWILCSGLGTVYSYTIVHKAPSPAFEADVPYVVAIIELAEGPHLMSNVVGVRPSEVCVGQRVRVDFREVEAGMRIPVFVPA